MSSCCSCFVSYHSAKQDHTFLHEERKWPDGTMPKTSSSKECLSNRRAPANPDRSNVLLFCHDFRIIGHWFIWKYNQVKSKHVDRLSQSDNYQGCLEAESFSCGHVPLVVVKKELTEQAKSTNEARKITTNTILRSRYHTLQQ